MKTKLSITLATLALAAFIAGNAAAYPGGSDRNAPSSGGGDKSGNNKSAGNSSSGGRSNASGGSSSNSNGPNNSGKVNSSGGSSVLGGSNSGPVRINTNPGSRQGSGGGPVISGGNGGSSIHVNSGNKIVLKSNPIPKVLNSNNAKNVLSSKDHSADHSKDHSSDHSKDHGSKSTSHDHSSGDKNHHYHDNPHYAYHHVKGDKWDKNEWNHCWYRWWYFHNNHSFVNGSWCWWDPDVSQWTVYREGDSIPEDYLVKDEAPPAASDSIRIALPADAEAPLSYVLNEYNFQIKPGDHQDLTTDRTWVIAFNRGGDFGDAEYTLEPGAYTFGPSDHGWELVRTSESEDATSSTAQESNLPKNLLPK